ncbi:MAG: hypothetical protein ACRDTT_09705 [Pseudonocardiaceae bacterium]
MSSPTRDVGPPDGADLPAPVVAALDEVEAGLPDVTTPADPSRHTLADNVARRLHRRVHDPITRALLSRPKIFAWCLEQAVQPAQPPLYRTADPLPEQPSTQPPAATRTTRTPGRRDTRKD